MWQDEVSPSGTVDGMATGRRKVQAVIRNQREAAPPVSDSWIMQRVALRGSLRDSEGSIKTFKEKEPGFGNIPSKMV